MDEQEGPGAYEREMALIAEMPRVGRRRVQRGGRLCGRGEHGGSRCGGKVRAVAERVGRGAQALRRRVGARGARGGGRCAHGRARGDAAEARKDGRARLHDRAAREAALAGARRGGRGHGERGLCAEARATRGDGEPARHEHAWLRRGVRVRGDDVRPRRPRGRATHRQVTQPLAPLQKESRPHQQLDAPTVSDSYFHFVTYPFFPSPLRYPPLLLAYAYFYSFALYSRMPAFLSVLLPLLIQKYDTPRRVV
ncbi:hypothetical protein FB451DRAFT_125558 [Mycena latifolia]|nr:hypothetical protein FB451DRAFT_125558 [Mycena latifolia]